jgi:hypothetical protein
VGVGQLIDHRLRAAGLRDVLEKRPDFGGTHGGGVPFVVKQDKAGGSVHVALGRLGSAKMVKGSLADLVEEPRRGRRGGGRWRQCGGHGESSQGQWCSG